MRIAALYDIHGNLPALEAVMRDVREAGVDRMVIGGDVLPGPMPRECLEMVEAAGVPTLYVHGNGERDVLTCMGGEEPTRVPEERRGLLHWTARQLDAAHERRLAQWPLTCRLRSDELGELLFCHATPRSDNELFTRLTPDALLGPMLEGVIASVVVCGHTHMQFERTLGDVHVINAGSVGMPFGEAGAHWLLVDDEIRLQRTVYDTTAASDLIAVSSMPGAAEFAARVRRPPTENEMVATFERAVRPRSPSIDR